jgi:dihydroxy-acid dehydratase
MRHCLPAGRIKPRPAGPLALVRNGDLITLDVPARRLHLHVDEPELERRRVAWTTPPPAMTSG